MINEKSGAGRVVASGLAAYAVLGLVNGFVPLLFLNFNREFGLGFVALGLLILLHFGLRGAGDLFSGMIASKLGYKLTIAVGFILIAFGLMGLGFLPEYIGGKAGVIITTVLTGIGVGLTAVPVGNLIDRYTDDDQRNPQFLHIFYALGQFGGIVISALFFLVAGTNTWEILSALWALLPIICTTLFIIFPFEDPEKKAKGEDFKRALIDPAFLVLFIIMFCAGGAEQSMAQWIAVHAEISLEHANVLGRLIGPALFAAGLGIARYVYMTFSGRIKIQRFMVYAAAAAVAAYLISALSGNEILSLVGCVLVGCFVGMLRTGTFSLASSKMPGEETVMFALLMFAGDLGYGVGPALVGIASGLFDINLKKGMFIALIFPIAMMITIMKVNRNLTGKLIRDRKTWIGIACAALVVTLSAFTGGCSGTVVTTPTPTPTPIVLETPIPLSTPTLAPTQAIATPTEVPATPTPTPTRKPAVTPTNTATPTPVEPTGFPDVTIYSASGKVAATASINIRRGPGTDYQVIGGGKIGEEFVLTGTTSNGWYQISYNNGHAYISQTYSRLVSGQVQPTQGVVIATATPTPWIPATPTPISSVPTMSLEDYVRFDGTAYIAIDAKTGAILAKKNENVSYSPASLTKMMTALIAVEQFYLNDTCDMSLDALRWNDVSYEGNTVKGIDNEMVTYALTVKEKTGKEFTAEQWMSAKYTVEERLYQMLVASCADAAEALAYKIEHNLDFFAEELMAEKADNLGLTNSYFTNAVGADDSCADQFAGNRSTARDLAIIAKALMEDGTLRKIVGSASYTVKASGDIPSVRLTNRNLLVSDSSYRSDAFTCIGIKSGHTDEAGYCLAACGTDSTGREIIVVTLGNQTRQGNAEQTLRILEYLFRYTR